MTAPRTSLVTDWRTKDEDLPDLAPGEDYERVFTPQLFVVLHRIIVRGPTLVNLRVGALLDVPFELERHDAEVRSYRPKDLTVRFFDRGLAKIGAAAVGENAIAIPPGMDVWLVLRNEGAKPTKPRAALMVQEETR